TISIVAKHAEARADKAPIIVRDGKVVPAIAGEVPKNNRNRCRADRAGGVTHRGCEGAVPFIEEHTHVSAAPVGDGQVRLAVAVQVPERNRNWTTTSGESNDGGKGAIP